MENTKITLESGIELDVSGIFYVFDSKYYFIYTNGEAIDTDYIQLYVVQVCKEVKNTPQGPVDTGNMLGIEITDQEEWKKIQGSITKIIESKKNGSDASGIQYLPINMLINLKVVSKNKFKLIKHVLKDSFNLSFEEAQKAEVGHAENYNEENIYEGNNINLLSESNLNAQKEDDVIIDYRAKFFEEQEKNRELLEQIKLLEEKIDSIKSILLN